MLSFDNSDWTTIVNNLKKACSKWGWFYYLFVWEEDYNRTYGRYYVEMVQSALLFVLESWVITPRIMRELGSLDNQVARRIYCRMTWQ